MDQMELVERLREKTGCSYTEAKAALEQGGNDLLEALCWLEQHGKNAMTCTTGSSEQGRQEAPKQEQKKAPREPGAFKRGCSSLWEGLVEFFRSCNETELVMTSKEGRKEFGIPLSLMIVLLILAWWVMVVLLIVALFLGKRFSLEGTFGRQDVNAVLGKATDFAENVKEKFTSEDEQH